MGGAGDHYEGITIDVVRPDGSKETLGPYQADPTGGAHVPPYVPSQTGNYTFTAHYPGQTISGGVVYEPSDSVTVTLVVQSEPIPTYASPPLPTEYWSRPIYASNYAWGQIGGNWFGMAMPAFTDTGGYDATGNFQPYSTAPNTGHIMWTKPTAFGGQPGMPIPSDGEHQYESTSILFRAFEPVILNGILYYREYPSFSNVAPYWVAVDIRTGQTLWTKQTNDILRMGQTWSFHTMQEYGSLAFLWGMSGGGFSGTPLQFHVYDALTGASVFNITNANPISGFLGGTTAFLMDTENTTEPGTLLTWYISGGNLTMWNSTQCIAYPRGFSGTYAEIIRPSGTIDFSAGNQWSIPLPYATVNGVNITDSLGVAAMTHDVILLRAAPNYATQSVKGYQIVAGIDAKTGKVLWGPLNQTIPQYQDVSVIGARDGVYILHNKDTDEAYGYSLKTGEMLWGPVALPGNAYSHLSRAAEVAYDTAFIWDFGGYVNALNATTGKILWTFEPQDAGYNTPYGIYPIWQFGSQSICDGKLFLAESHMYNPPLFPGAQRLAINCTDGSLVWSELGFYGRICAAHADGYMIQWNSYDNQIYSLGKGPTATTVSIQNNVVTHGDTVLVQGTVTDQSAGTQDSDRSARFPNGVPAISDQDMSAWMEYVYMQQPKPTNASGVKVVLTVLDPNNNCYNVATTTSDEDGFYSAVFTPEVPGKYTVYATFEGSESYWPSTAVTALNVLEPPQATPPPTPTPAPLTDTYVLSLGLAAIIAIVAIGLVIILMLRKR
jgi:hypothetical protein